MTRLAALAGAVVVVTAAQPGQAAGHACGSMAPADQRMPATAVRPSPTDFVVHLTRRVDPALVTVMYSLFNVQGGGRGGYAVREPAVRIAPEEIAIDTALEGRMAYALAAVIYVRGYAFGFLDVSSLANTRTATLDLTPLPTVPLSGQVALAGLPVTGPYRLEIGYDASAMVFAFEAKARRRLGVVAGGGSPFTTTLVAAATVAANGSFTAAVPDFLADPAVAATPGTFAMFTLSASPLRVLKLSAAPDRRGPPLTVPLARQYRPIDLRIAP